MDIWNRAEKRRTLRKPKRIPTYKSIPLKGKNYEKYGLWNGYWKIKR